MEGQDFFLISSVLMVVGAVTELLAYGVEFILVTNIYMVYRYLFRICLFVWIFKLPRTHYTGETPECSKANLQVRSGLYAVYCLADIVNMRYHIALFIRIT